MPTGYTAGVQDGEITEFKTFALQCARAFGACIDLRDEPLSAAIPEFTASTHHADALPYYYKRYYQLMHMSSDACKEAAHEEHDAANSRWAKREGERIAQKARYQAMLDAVNAWTPPTPDHEGLKKFMLEQLTGSIEHDCGEPMELPRKLEWWKWIDNQVSSSEWHIDYHEKCHAEEVERVAKRNAWVKSLRESL